MPFWMDEILLKLRYKNKKNLMSDGGQFSENNVLMNHPLAYSSE